MNTQSVLRASWGFLCLLTAGCGGHGSSDDDTATDAGTAADASYPGEDLGLPPVADGATRYETQPVTVPAGGDVLWSEWVAPPLDSDMDVVSVTGLQSQGGHHAILFGTTNVQPVGTSRAWQNDDQLTTVTYGAVGGEGNDSLQLPDGVVLRATKGHALMVQSHYLNTTAQPIVGRTVMDVKFGPVDPTKQVASTLAAASLKVSIPPNSTTSLDVTCKLQQDYHVLMYANHMHSYGVSVSTELVNADGTKTPLKVDATWDPSWAFHPNYTRFTLQSAQLLPAGSTIHTTCTWTNTTVNALNFPDEMCTFAGYVLADLDADCVDGQWL
jgi:hypothetical protein